MLEALACLGFRGEMVPGQDLVFEGRDGPIDRTSCTPFGDRSARFVKPLANDFRVVLSMAEAFSSR
jgi:hypothetical protein